MSGKKPFVRVLIAVSAAAVALVGLALIAQPMQAITYRDVPAGGSIQAAINAAAAGDIIRVQQGTFTESLTIDKSVALLGGFTDFTTGVRVPRATVISPTGRAMNITGTGITVTVDGLEIKNAAFAGSGAGINVDVNASSKVVINDNSIHHNRATSGSGGGIYVRGDTRSAIELTGNDVMTNTASSDGGGLYANIGGWSAFVLTGTHIISNSASNGGGFYAMVRAAALSVPVAQSASDSSPFSIQDNLVMSNTATGDNGGLYLTVQSRQGAFDRNHVIGNGANNSRGGGSLTLASSSSTFYSNEFRRNVAATSIGGLQASLVSNSSLTGDGLVVADNQATGGSTGGLSIVADLVSSIDLPNSVITGNLAQDDYGGGSLSASNGSRLNILNTFVQNNRSVSGTVGGLGLSTFSSWITATQMTVISNTAPDEVGGVAGDVQFGSLLLTGGAFERNTSTNGAGGLSVGSIMGGASLDLSGSHFFTNTGSSGGGASVGVVDLNSTLLLNDTTFVSNTAQTQGGGVYVGSIGPTGRVEIDPSHFERNVAQTGNGGGISLGTSAGQFSLTGADLLHNWAGGSGGAMYLASLQIGQAAINSNRIISNVASASGGGIFLGNATQLHSLAMKNNTVSSNAANGPGGGIFLGTLAQVNSLEMMSNTISLNTANGPGGGLYLSALDTASWLMSGSVITGNSAQGGPGFLGGGIYIGTVNNAPLADLDNSQVNDNSATGDGGGLYIGNLNASVLTMRSSQFLRNRAMGPTGPANGGGGCSIMNAGNSSQVWLDNTQVNGNVTNGSGGGCLFNNFNVNTLLSAHNSQFNDNKAGMNAGGVLLYVHVLNARIEFVGNQVNGNQAGITTTLPTATGSQAGGISMFLPVQAQAVFSSNEIRNNTAYLGTLPDSGTCGGICTMLTASTLTMQDNTLSGNTAQRNFGGLSVVMPILSQLVMEHNVIASNTAITDVGGVNVQGGGNSQYNLRRNQIVSNTAGSKGGLWIIGMDPTLVITSQNNLIALNQGSGLYLQDANFHSTNDTLADNGTYGVVLTGTFGISTTAWLTNTIIWGHTGSFTSTQVPTYTMAATFSDIQGGWSGAGNLNTDPLFIGSGDYHLQPTSPVKDQADTADAPAVDLDGNPRPYNTVADMGCYEYGLFAKIYLPIVVRN